MGPLLLCFSLSLIQVADAGILGNVTMPVEFFKLNVDYEHPDKIFKEFDDFVAKFKRDYKTLEEKQFRFNQFVKSYNEIAQLNAEAKKRGFDTKYGINNFADRTKEEFSRGLSHVRPVPHTNLSEIEFNLDDSNVKRTKRQSYPKNFDLRSIRVKGSPIVGPVKAQGLCGCCWAFAATAVAETAYALDTGKFELLSDQEVCDCGTQRNSRVPGCTGGDLGQGLIYISRNGLPAERRYRYEDGRSKYFGMCEARSKKRTLRANTVSFFELPSRNVEKNIMSQLYNYNIPVAAFFRIDNDFKYYESGIVETEQCRVVKEEEWHSAAIIGFGTDIIEVPRGSTPRSVEYWLLKNSWEDNWGDAGYVKVARGTDWCMIEDRPVTVRLNNGGYNYDY